MNVGPDGSLCRITSSAKGIISNVKIVKVSENETLNTDEPEYKLIFIGEEEKNNESLSEESDEEAFEKELFQQTNVKLSRENIEKDKDVKVQEDIEESKHEKEKFPKRTNGRFRSNNTHRANKNYKSFGKRNFNPSGSVTLPYNRSKTNTRSQDICPWIQFPPANLIPHQYRIFHQYQSGAEPILNNSVTPCKPVGLLGDSPSSHFHQRHFQSSYQSDPYRHGQNFGKEDYSSSYQTVQNRQGSSPPLNYQNERWKNKNKSKFWKRNQNESRKDRRNNKSYYPYRK